MPFFWGGGGWGLKNPKIIFDQFTRHFRQFWTTLILTLNYRVSIESIITLTYRVSSSHCCLKCPIWLRFLKIDEGGKSEYHYDLILRGKSAPFWLQFLQFEVGNWSTICEDLYFNKKEDFYYLLFSWLSVSQFPPDLSWFRRVSRFLFQLTIDSVLGP